MKHSKGLLTSNGHFEPEKLFRLALIKSLVCIKFQEEKHMNTLEAVMYTARLVYSVLHNICKPARRMKFELIF